MTRSTTPRRRRGARFWDRPVAVKLGASIALLGLTFAVVGASGGVALLRAQGKLETMRQLTEELQGSMASLRTAQTQSHLLVRRAAEAPDDAARTQLLTASDWNDRSAAALIEKVSAFPESDTQQWADFQARWAAWLAYRDSAVLPLVKAGDAVGVAQALDASMAADPDNAGRALGLADGQVRSRVQAVMAEASAEIRLVVVVLVIAFLVAITLTAALAAGVTRRLTRGLRTVQGAVEAMATGDLTTPAVVAERDELGQMAGSLTAAQEALRTMMAGVVESAELVAAAAEELSASNAEVAAGSEETSTQADVVATAAGEVSRNVQAVAAGAEQMGSSIREIAQNATQAAKVAAEASATTQAAAGTIGELGEAAREIGTVVKAITQIAEQTNLLALNATIEAARAGDAGKGFAVVAEEVKELAQESARAAEDIATRIQANQAMSTSAVAAIEQVTQVIAAINDYQMTIASAVEEQTATTTEMTRGVTDAATGSGEIAANMSGIAGAAASSSRVLSQMQTATDELARMSAELRSRVEAFTY